MADYQIQFYVGGPALKVNDLVQARMTDYDQRSFKRVLYEVLGRVTDVSREGQATISIYSGAENLSRFGRNMTFTRFGNTTDASRQGFILITSDDIFDTAGFDSQGAAPYLDIRDGVNSYASRSDIGTLRFRAGNLAGLHDDDFGTYQPQGYGIYTDNIYAKGTFVLGAGSKGFAMLDDAPQSIADLDANYGPMFMDYPMSSGLFISTKRLGYYNYTVAQETGNTDRGWMTYMGADGTLLLRGKVDEDAYFLWTAVDGTGHSSLTLHNAALTGVIVPESVPPGIFKHEYGVDWYGYVMVATTRVTSSTTLVVTTRLADAELDWMVDTQISGVTVSSLFGGIGYSVGGPEGAEIMITNIYGDEIAMPGDATINGYSITAMAESINEMATAITGKADKSAVNGEYEFTYSGMTILSMTIVDGVITAIS